MTRFQITFLALVGCQAGHSVEEYMGQLYNVFPPARLVSGLVSQDLERGFIILNVALVGFGIWCLLWPVRLRWPVAVPLAWLWIAIELVNGIGHPLWSLVQRQYTPGVATAPVLLALALYLAWHVRPGRGGTAAAA
jgi:hypothetical protein